MDNETIKSEIEKGISTEEIEYLEIKEKKCDDYLYKAIPILAVMYHHFASMFEPGSDVMKYRKAAVLIKLGDEEVRRGGKLIDGYFIPGDLAFAFENFLHDLYESAKRVHYEVEDDEVLFVPGMKDVKKNGK